MEYGRRKDNKSPGAWHPAQASLKPPPHPPGRVRLDPSWYFEVGSSGERVHFFSGQFFFRSRFVSPALGHKEAGGGGCSPPRVGGGGPAGPTLLPLEGGITDLKKKPDPANKWSETTWVIFAVREPLGVLMYSHTSSRVQSEGTETEEAAPPYVQYASSMNPAGEIWGGKKSVGLGGGWKKGAFSVERCLGSKIIRVNSNE